MAVILSNFENYSTFGGFQVPKTPDPGTVCPDPEFWWLPGTVSLDPEFGGFPGTVSPDPEY